MGSSISDSEAPRVILDTPKPEEPKVTIAEEPPVEKTREMSPVKKVEVCNL